MAISDNERRDCARKLILKIFVEVNSRATLSFEDIKAAIDSIDDSFDALASEFTQNRSIEFNFNSRLPEPFRSTASVEQKSLAVAFVAMKRGGVI